MATRVQKHALSIDKMLYDLVNDEIIPGTRVAADDFWQGLDEIVKQFAANNQKLLEQRDALQSRIDAWHQQHGADYALPDYKAFLDKIGYLVEAGPDFAVDTDGVDDELAVIAGPQLVVPLDNARYAINAANARWSSLYAALYDTDAIPATEGGEKTAEYNPVRGARVARFVGDWLDNVAPPAAGSHHYAVQYRVEHQQLVITMDDGSQSGLAERGRFVGYTGDRQSPDSVLLKHHNLHIRLKMDTGQAAGRAGRDAIRDVEIESAITAIMDCEDSVAAVDAADKVKAYRNWAGLMRGELTLTFDKDGKTVVRELAPDREFVAPAGGRFTLPGRSLMLVRTVGTHIYTDAVTAAGREIPEAFLDLMVTVLAARHDLLHNGPHRNSRAGSIYIVKPKMHGPREVAEAVALFAKVEQCMGLARNTLKIGIMDEERRTTVNLKQCIRAAQTRVVFINTGFLDRTGDEIHTCMQAGPMPLKHRIKSTPWLLAYEDRNVDMGLAVGLHGRGQIGKGMWAEPNSMAAMLEQKIAHPRAGANTAWVPSPTAATLHALHYHAVNVKARQEEISTAARASLDDILTIPVVNRGQPSQPQIQYDLENNVQSILGYVVRWVDHGVGCSTVPDMNDVGLMEDRATLRISSQHIANWLHHGLVTRAQVLAAFQKMAVQVDAQNAGQSRYRNMAPECDGMAYRAALELVFHGCESANGYTEPILYRYRRQAKAQAKAPAKAPAQAG